MLSRVEMSSVNAVSRFRVLKTGTQERDVPINLHDLASYVIYPLSITYDPLSRSITHTHMHTLFQQA